MEGPQRQLDRFCAAAGDGNGKEVQQSALGLVPCLLRDVLPSGFDDEAGEARSDVFFGKHWSCKHDGNSLVRSVHTSYGEVIARREDVVSARRSSMRTFSLPAGIGLTGSASSFQGSSMSATRRQVLLGSAATFLVTSAFGQAAAQAASGEPILLGVSGPLTGQNAQYGAQWKAGFDLALDEINGAGGIKGRPLQYDFEDSQSDPRQSVAIAQKFVADKRIVVELGDFASPASMAASPIYQKAKLVQFGFTNSHPDFTKGGDYMWSNSVSQADEQPLSANFAIKRLGIKRIAVLHLNTDWGRTSKDIFVKTVKDLGAEVVAIEGYLADEKDFRSTLVRVRDAKPDGLMLISYYSDAALIARQVKQAGINLPTAAASSVYSPKFIELKLFVAATGYKLPTSCWTYNAEHKWTEILGRMWLKPGFEQTDRDPAVCITWNDAMAYVGWLGRTTGKAYRLPTEAEWEYAARAGSKSSRFWGDSRDGACLYGNFADLTAAAAFKTEPRHEVVFYCSDGVVYTAPVGSFQPNAFGLYDMLGNVWEWTADCVNWRYVAAPADGSAWLSGDCKSHVLRGGSWNDDPWAARAAVRSNALALLGSANLGFRVARSD